MRQEHVGRGVGFVGALLTMASVALPWARFSAFGLEIGLPGGLWLGCAIGAALATLGAGMLQRAPWLSCALALVCLSLAWQGRTNAPREVVRRKLEIQRTLAPLNERLARIALPPLEPFEGVGRASDHTGPGGALALAGSGLLLLGGLLCLQSRRCRGCKTLFRSEALRFCTRCGLARTGGPYCKNCGTPAHKSDLHCARCGGGILRP